MVPLIPYLSLLFQAHSTSIKAIKYICKCINKGSDQAVFNIGRQGGVSDYWRSAKIAIRKIHQQQWGSVVVTDVPSWRASFYCDSWLWIFRLAKGYITIKIICNSESHTLSGTLSRFFLSYVSKIFFPRPCCTQKYCDTTCEITSRSSGSVACRMRL